MDRINKIGKTLLEYKTELLKHYSPIVDDSLMIALDTQMDKRLLTKEDYDLIIDDNISLETFEKHILNKKEYIKSSKELMTEFEKVREVVNNGLININFTDFIETESNIDTNKISILRQYTITDAFIKVYFGLEDKDMEIIMKKKGFAEKFAVLRLTKIFKEIYSEMRADQDYAQGFSKVYYNNDYNGFSIDYKYHLNVDNIDKENIEAKLKKIRDTDKVVERKFLKKTSMQFYNVKQVEPINNSLDVDKNVPTNKTKEVEIKESEINEIKNQTNEHIEDNTNKALNNNNNLNTKENENSLSNNKNDYLDNDLKKNITKTSDKNLDNAEISSEDLFEIAENLISNENSSDPIESDFQGELPVSEEENLDNSLEDDLFSEGVPDIPDLEIDDLI